MKEQNQCRWSQALCKNHKVDIDIIRKDKDVPISWGNTLKKCMELQLYGNAEQWNILIEVRLDKSRSCWCPAIRCSAGRLPLWIFPPLRAELRLYSFKQWILLADPKLLISHLFKIEDETRQKSREIIS